MAAAFRRLTHGGRDAPKLAHVECPGPRDLVIDVGLRDLMQELVELAEGHAETAVLADFKAARVIAAARARAEGITLAGWEVDPDLLQARLGRFRDAARRLDLVARVG